MTPALLGIVAALSWGAHDFIGRFATRSVGQFATTLGVMLTGAIVLTVIVLAFGGGATWPGSGMVAICAFAGGSYALATLCLFSAYRIGSLSIVSPLVGAYPALVIVWNVALGSRPSAWAWAAMLAVMAGTAIVSAAGTHHEEQGHVERGRLKPMLVFSGLSAVCYAVSVIAGQTAAPVIGEMQTTWIARAFAVATLLPLLVNPDYRRRAPMIWWPAIMAMGLFDTLAMISVFKAGQMPEAEIAAVAGSSFGGVVALLGRFFFKEPVTTLQWGGIGLIFMGTGVLTLGW
ncbi:MAG: DMT family transporter [Parvibaculaceae bacterium]